MITLAGKTYVKTQKEMTESLFSSGGTCAGFYQTRKNGVLFLDIQKVPFAFAARDVRTGGTFFVTASRSEGRTFFMFGLGSYTEKQLGIENLSYSQQKDAAKNVIQQAAIL